MIYVVSTISELVSRFLRTACLSLYKKSQCFLDITIFVLTQDGGIRYTNCRLIFSLKFKRIATMSRDQVFYDVMSYFDLYFIIDFNSILFCLHDFFIHQSILSSANSLLSLWVWAKGSQPFPDR